jgi:antitoxin CcdA
MIHEHPPGTRLTRPTNVTLSAALVEEAKKLGINISSAAAAGLEQAVARKRAQRWISDNGPALASYNEFVEEHGLPLAKFRLF